MLPGRHPWTYEPACADDPDAMFVSQAAEQRRAARVCVRCLVRAECLTEALAQDMQWGVWGGLTAGERRKLLRSAS